MADTKIMMHILPALVEGPFGGGNQFAKALRASLVSRGYYAERLQEANVLLFNGYPFRDPHIFHQAIRWKQKYPEQRSIVIRIDGPIAAIRHDATSEKYDRALYAFTTLAADGVISQSRWSFEQISNHVLAPQNCAFAIIGNAPDPAIFYPPKARQAISGRKIRIVTTSWSSNPHKGFATYAWLDQHLDFEKFEFSVIAPTKTPYKNIKTLKPVDQPDLGHLLRDSDIYLTASRIEACSNAVLEALHCGLPVIAPNASSHPEYVPSADLLFGGEEEIGPILDKVANNLELYQNQIEVQDIAEVTQSYLDFAQKCRSQSVKKISGRGIRDFLKANNITASTYSRAWLHCKVLIKYALLRTRSG